MNKEQGNNFSSLLCDDIEVFWVTEVGYFDRLQNDRLRLTLVKLELEDLNENTWTLFAIPLDIKSLTFKIVSMEA